MAYLSRHIASRSSGRHRLLATSATTAADGPPFAARVLCQKPTEYPESYKGITLCPVCAWQEAQRSVCSG